MDDDLTDSQWARLEPLLAQPANRRKGGRPQLRSRRQLIDGIRWRFREGASWNRLPAEYGPHQTAYALFYEWRADGTWERLATALGDSADDRRILPWIHDGSFQARDEP
ncbi:transposase [Catenulispora rubra]|uniref:transposase n=1 Tax=Catenulispora rubra TaxID=280293 RepID=UPI0018927F43|nr:transposase [Catenulispora rubra]